MKIISNSVWNVIKNLIPSKKSCIGRPPLDPRKVLEGILFIIDSGAQWRLMPKEYGSKSAIHRTFRKWIREKVFEKIMYEAQAQYLASQDDNWLWFATDTSFSKAPLAKEWSGKNPTDRGKRGVKKSVVVDKNGAPLAVHVGAANTHDSQLLMLTINQLNMTFEKTAIIAADSAYDSKILRKKCSEKNIALISSVNKRRDKKRTSYTPNHRWIVEQTFGIFHWKRGLKTCWTKTQESFLAFVQLVAAERLFKLSRI